MKVFDKIGGLRCPCCDAPVTWNIANTAKGSEGYIPFVECGKCNEKLRVASGSGLIHAIVACTLVTVFWFAFGMMGLFGVDGVSLFPSSVPIGLLGKSILFGIAVVFIALPVANRSLKIEVCK